MWSIDLVRRRERGSPDTRPLLLSASERQRQIVAHCCERAHRAGVRAGMPVAQARALFTGVSVRVEAHDPQRDRLALRALASWARRFSPTAAIDEPGGLLLDVTGCQRLFGGDERLASLVVRDLNRLGVRARVAIAPTFGCAWGVARFGEHDIAVIDERNTRRSLSPLPIRALRVEPEVVAALAEVGLERVGDLLELPRSTLPARFGRDVLLRLDRALGQAIETVEAVRPAPPPCVERIFEGPSDRIEAIEGIVRELLAALCASMESRQVGARTVEVELVRSDLDPEVLRVTLGRASQDAEHLWRLVRPRLERAHLGFGVEAVRVRASSVGVLRDEQASMVREADHSADHARTARALDELLDTLVNRFGHECVRRARLAESHAPERAFEMLPTLDADVRAQASSTRNDRPTLLFDRPEAVRVLAMTPDGPVCRVEWGGESHEVIACFGPERIAGEWWRAKGGTRDCFAVQTREGLWLWLVRALETGEWYAHGVWS